MSKAIPLDVRLPDVSYLSNKCDVKGNTPRGYLELDRRWQRNPFPPARRTEAPDARQHNSRPRGVWSSSGEGLGHRLRGVRRRGGRDGDRLPLAGTRRLSELRRHDTHGGAEVVAPAGAQTVAGRGSSRRTRPDPRRPAGSIPTPPASPRKSTASSKRKARSSGPESLRCRA